MIRDTVPRALNTHPHSPCYDDIRFVTADRELAAEAIAICDGCTFRACVPVLAEILASPGRHQLEGVWDGKHYRENNNPRRVAADPQSVSTFPLENRVTHCCRNHELTEENAYTDARGKRNCRTCGREARRRYKDRQKGDAA